MFSTLVYLAAFCFFYYKYVPLARSFQIVLIPILALTIVTTALNVEWGLVFFIFSFPLINNLPYFFRIYLDTPHAPTALVLFLALFLGWLVHHLLDENELSFNRPVFRPLGLFSLVLLVSLVITFLRYANFFPFISDRVYELTVNARGVRAGGALMSNLFSFLSYVTGFGLFLVIINQVKSREFIKKILVALSFSALIYLSFALVQRFHSLSLGNLPLWVSLGQLNSTFKDPNSFAAILTAFIPVLLGMAFFFQAKLRFFSVGLIILSLLVFPLTGSRSGFLALGISLLSFLILFLISSEMKLRKKVTVASSFLLILILLSGVVVFSFKDSILSKRLGWSLDVLSAETSWNQLFKGRFELWKAAMLMIKQYPLSGVGVGAYVIELPNYLKLLGLGFRFIDSAENYFVQVAAELGFIGLIIAFWLFYEVIKQIKRSWKAGDDNLTPKNRFILIGVISGITGIFTNFLFHTYIGSYEVQYFFWLLIGLVFVGSKDGTQEVGKTETHKKPGLAFKIAGIVSIVVFGASLLWNSAHSLSINSRTERFGWRQDFGFYQEEKDDRGRFFRWAKKSCGITIEKTGTELVIPIIASHPDIENKPVEVKIYSADKYFRKQKLLRKITLNRRGWIDVELSTSGLSAGKFQLIFETSRAWLPLKLGVPDPRRLAIGLGDEWFKHPD